MAKTVSLTTLRSRVRIRYDAVNDTTAVTDAEIDQYINDALQEYYDLVIAAFSDDYFAKSGTITTASGTATYTLPSDFYKLIYVDIGISSQTYSMKKFTVAERNMYKSYPAASGANYPCMYRLIGGLADGTSDQIEFIPTPSGVYTVTLRYVPAYPTLSSGSDVINVLPGGDVYIVEAACAKIAQREEVDPGQYLAQQGLAAQRIRMMAPSRDYQPDRVNEVEYLGVWDPLSGWYW